MQWLRHLRRRVEREMALAGESSAETRASERAFSRYRALVKAAPPEAIERAYAEGLSALSLPQRRIIEKELQRLAPSAVRELRQEATGGGLAPEVLAGAAARIEQRRPAFLEPVVRGNGAQASVFAALLTSVVASEPAAYVLGRSADTPARDAAADTAEPDIAPEFGHEPSRDSAVGGSGFERDKFDFEV
ncbi:MAG TPA: hypothetical protein VIM73_06665 [Polyangiaceae bacterium]